MLPPAYLYMEVPGPSSLPPESKRSWKTAQVDGNLYNIHRSDHALSTSDVRLSSFIPELHPVDNPYAGQISHVPHNIVYLLHLAFNRVHAPILSLHFQRCQVPKTDRTETSDPFQISPENPQSKSMHVAKRALRNAIPVSLFFFLPTERPLNSPP